MRRGEMEWGPSAGGWGLNNWVSGTRDRTGSKLGRGLGVAS